MIQKITRKLLDYLARNLKSIQSIVVKHPDCLTQSLSPRQLERLGVIVALYERQEAMCGSEQHSVPTES